ncbi:unnamed protein product [Protopolystoma xenopodis]|uniref:Uncharacterized protein n=1 Tax=Protopolystoma xenopodis TaxID=117903 RepID=A0A448WXV5_9PLAT|nr:unnamed protein product [Protopolystoma xenopodis]
MHFNPTCFLDFLQIRFHCIDPPGCRNRTEHLFLGPDPSESSTITSTSLISWSTRFRHRLSGSCLERYAQMPVFARKYATRQVSSDATFVLHRPFEQTKVKKTNRTRVRTPAHVFKLVELNLDDLEPRALYEMTMCSWRPESAVCLPISRSTEVFRTGISGSRDLTLLLN